MQQIPDSAVVAQPEASPGSTFDFDIEYTFPPTEVKVHNTCAFVCPVRQPFIRLDDYIENPLGKTWIFNASGDILSGSGHELIRTNVLDLDAPQGNIGHQSPTHANPDPERNPIEVELVDYIHPDADFCGSPAPCRKLPVVTVDAGKDAVVDLTYFRRIDPAVVALGTPGIIVIDRVRAGDDVDVVLNDSKNGDGQTGLVLVVVDLYHPSILSKYYGFTFPSTYDPLINDGLSYDRGLCAGAYPGNCGSGSGSYETHFRPDVSDPNLAHILRALGTDVDGEIESTYDFADLRAGDDIDVCHVTTGGEEPKTCFTTQIDSATHTVTADTPDTTVHIIAQVDSAWTGGAGHVGPVDDPGMAVNVSQIFLRTNGNITATEIEGDMLVGHIHSTNGDVILHSPRRILDADGRPTIDVTGVNITMYAGEGGALGGIGVPSNWLEINTAVNQPTGIGGGVLKAYDTAAAIGGGSTEGIFLDELTGDMPIWEIFTGGSSSLATGNVGLRTTGGSILNAKLDPDEDNVRGDAVDIDANGGSIGLTSKDVMVDSGRAPPFGCTWLNCGDDPNSPWKSDPALAAAGDDVGLEATAGIYFTETDAYLRLVLAHALTGDIRLTVRESVQLDEDLYLVLRHRPVRRINTRGPRATTSTPRAASRTARSSPRPATSNSASATTSRCTRTARSSPTCRIDIRGDFGNLDTGGGAARVRHVDDPARPHRRRLRRLRTPAPATTRSAPAPPRGVNPVPGRQTNVWGGSDVDVILLGDRSGLDRAQTSDPGAQQRAAGRRPATSSSARRRRCTATARRLPRTPPTARTSSRSTTCSR